MIQLPWNKQRVNIRYARIIIDPRRRHEYIFVYGNVFILIKISLKFVPKGPIDSKSVLVQMMAPIGDESLSISTLDYFTAPYMYMFMCITRPRWITYVLCMINHYEYRYRDILFLLIHTLINVSQCRMFGATTVWATPYQTYRKTSNIRRILVGNKIVDHSDAVGASPVGAAPTTSSFST